LYFYKDIVICHLQNACHFLKNVLLAKTEQNKLNNSLIVSHKDKVVFSSNQHWLYPLFELEDFLKQNNINASELFVRDKIAGRAAACLMVHLGIKQCHIGLISRLATTVYDRCGVAYTYDKIVDEIQCRTENLIDDDMRIADAYLLLRKRAGRVKGLPVKMTGVSLKMEEKLLLDKVDLFVSRGEQLVIHGANGAGKTTLLRAMLGFVPVSEGTIEVGDYKVGSPGWKKNRSMVAYIHQESIKNGFPITAAEVVKIGLGSARLSRKDAEMQVEVAMRRTGSFHLYDQPYNTLSGGEKQRVSLARSLCQNAGVFLLDEPTSFLDQQGKDDLLELLREVSRNEAPTMILVSHEHQWTEKLNWKSMQLKGGALC
jgi:zinc transport system ATP-binding protein